MAEVLELSEDDQGLPGKDRLSFEPSVQPRREEITKLSRGGTKSQGNLREDDQGLDKLELI